MLKSGCEQRQSDKKIFSRQCELLTVLKCLTGCLQQTDRIPMTIGFKLAMFTQFFRQRGPVVLIIVARHLGDDDVEGKHLIAMLQKGVILKDSADPVSTDSDHSIGQPPKLRERKSQ